jgi:hypothetical protein
MEKALDIIAFGSHPFLIDRNQRLFQQFNKLDNVIHFDELKKMDGYYTSKFDNNKRILAIDSLMRSFVQDHIIDLIIPEPVLNSTENLSAEFKDSLNQSSHKKSWGIHLIDRDIAMRLSGKLPHINLAGTDFTVDWRLRQMRETELPWKNISFEYMETSEDGEELLCFYDTETHELFEPDRSLLEMPKNVVILQIPNEAKLDPVAVARELGIGLTDLLTEHPLKMELSAKVTPLSDSGLQQFIEQNRANLESQKQQEKRRR